MQGTDKFVIQALLETKTLETEETARKRRREIFELLDSAVAKKSTVDDVLEEIYKKPTEDITRAKQGELAAAEKDREKLENTLKKQREILGKAKRDYRIFVGLGVTAAIAAIPLIIITLPLTIPIGIFAAFWSRLRATTAEKFYSPILAYFIKNATVKRVAGDYKHLKEEIAKAEAAIVASNTTIKEQKGKISSIEEEIKDIKDKKINGEKKVLKQIIGSVREFEGNASKKVDCTFTLDTMGDVGVELLCRSLERLSKQSPAPAWKSLTLNLANCGLTENGRNRLAAVIESPESNNLKIREINLTGTKLREFLADEFCKALESNVTITTVKYDSEEISGKNRDKIAKQMVINCYLQNRDYAVLLKEMPTIFAGGTPEERLVNIKAAAEEKVKSHFICEADIAIPLVSRSPLLEQTLKQNSVFVSLMKKPEVPAFLEAYKYDSERCLAFINDRKLSIPAPEQLDGKELRVATANKNDEHVKRLLLILFEKPSLKKEEKEGKVSIFIKMLAMGNLVQSSPDVDLKIADAFAKLQASDNSSEIAPQLFKELRMTLIASGLEPSQLQTFNQVIQEDLRSRYDCLRGSYTEMFKPESLEALKKELDENHDLVAFEFKGSMNDTVIDYVNFICKRNLIIKSLENKTALSDEEVDKLIADFEGIKPEYYTQAKTLLKELLPTLTLRLQQSQKIESCLSQGMQEDLSRKYNCLKNLPGSLDPESFAALKKDLNDNYELTLFDFKKYTVGVTLNKDVKDYVDFICGRNQLLKLDENKAHNSPEEIARQLVKIIDGVSPGYYFEVRQLLDEKFLPHTKQLQDVESYLKRKILDTPDMLRVFTQKFKNQENPSDADVDEFMEILVGIKSNHYKAVEQAGEKNPFAAVIIQKYMMSGENPENLVKALQELKGKNPEAFEAMLKYHLRDSRDPNDKVKLIFGLLENTAYDKRVLASFIYGIVNTDTWKVKSLGDLKAVLDTLKLPIEKKRDTSFIVSELSKAEQQQAVKSEPQQAQVTYSSFQEDFMEKYECLAGNAGFVNEQSFVDLKKDLDENYKLTKFDFSTKKYTLTLAPKTAVQNYVNFICERNQVYENAKDKTAFIKAFTAINPSNYKEVLEQIGKKDPAFLTVVRKYMGDVANAGSPAAVKLAVTELQRLVKDKPKAFDALLRYHLNKPESVADIEYKVHLVTGLLKLLDAADSKKLNEEEKATVESVRKFIFGITSGESKNKTSQELEEQLKELSGIDSKKKLGFFESGIKADVIKVVHEAIEKIEPPRAKQAHAF